MPAEATSNVFAVIKNRNEAASYASRIPHDTIPEAMPQVLYSLDGGSPVSLADAYIVGDVIRVEPGISRRWVEGQDREIVEEVDFNSPKSMSTTVHLVVRVENSIVADSQPAAVHEKLRPGREVRVGLALGAQVDTKQIQADLSQGEGIAALLYAPSRVFEYDPSLWSVGRDGAYLGTVDKNDDVTFWAIDGPGQLERSEPLVVKRSELEAPFQGKPIAVSSTPQNGGT